MTTQNGNRLDRIEKILEQNAEQIAALVERQERTDRQIETLAEITDRLSARNAEQIAALAHEMSFLRAAVQGHITQSRPPAHQE